VTGTLPKDAEKLLAATPDEFVAERTRLARQLREAGRDGDARIVAETKKPSAVVLAVNRAARDRPQAARDAAKAAERLGPAQLSGKQDAYRELREELARASALVAEVAVAHVAPGKTASEAMRRRVNDHLRGALAGKATRDRLVRGTLTEEVEASGFEALSGVKAPARPSRRKAPAAAKREAERERRERKKLRDEIASTTRKLADAEKRVREATRERDELAGKLEQLRGSEP
jgi:hypothetical protein